LKVVLFCGGLGTRLRAHSETVPKPMVNIGYRPIIWHLMKYYAHFGHKDFILCLGYKGDVVKDYFLQYNECASNDFVLSEGGKKIDLLASDIQDWRITFVETGIRSNLGERLLAVRHLLEGEETFLANYSDGLCDANLDEYVSWFEKSGKTAAFMAVHPQSWSFHFVQMQGQELESIRSAKQTQLLVNGGYFVFKGSVFDHIQPGEELVEAPFHRLLAQGKLGAYRYEGFWSCMDTFKDKIRFDEMDASGERPWAVWSHDAR